MAHATARRGRAEHHAPVRRPLPRRVSGPIARPVPAPAGLVFCSRAPSLNRLAGLQWLAQLFFPGRFANDLRSMTKEFYSRFYQLDLTESQIDQLLVARQR